jgi:hypothetical protein
MEAEHTHEVAQRVPVDIVENSQRGAQDVRLQDVLRRIVRFSRANLGVSWRLTMPKTIAQLTPKCTPHLDPDI